MQLWSTTESSLSDYAGPSIPFVMRGDGRSAPTDVQKTNRPPASLPQACRASTGYGFALKAHAPNRGACLGGPMRPDGWNSVDMIVLNGQSSAAPPCRRARIHSTIQY